MLEEICCRGHIEKRRCSFPVSELREFREMVERTNAMGRYPESDERDEAIDAYMERFYVDGGTQQSRDTCTALYNFFQCFELEGDVTTLSLIDKLLAGERVGLTMEESIAGYGLSKDDAKLAFAELDMEDGW